MEKEHQHESESPDVAAVKQPEPHHTVVELKPQVQKSVFAKKAYELMLYIYGAIAVLLLFRFLFSLIGARQAAPYVEFVYGLSTPLMIPFSNMFGLVQSGPYRIEFEVLVALLVYGVILYGTAQLVRIIFD